MLDLTVDHMKERKNNRSKHWIHSLSEASCRKWRSSLSNRLYSILFTAFISLCTAVIVRIVLRQSARIPESLQFVDIPVFVLSFSQ